MRYAGSNNGATLMREYRVTGTDALVKGQPVIEGGASGEVKTVTGVNDLANVVGVTLEAVTGTDTQGQGENTADKKVLVSEAQPGTLYRARVNPGVTINTLFADADGSFLTNTSESTAGTTITDADVGSAAKAGGTVFALSGANKGQSRIITTLNSGTSIVVTKPFDYTIAVGDKFLMVPWHIGGNQTLSMTTIPTQANSLIAVGTGGPVVIRDFHLTTDAPASEDAPELDVVFYFTDSIWGQVT